MEIGNTSYKIVDLIRTIRVHVYAWGVNIVIADKSRNAINSKFDSRNFSLTKNYPTIEDNIKRGMRYYKAPQSSIGFMLGCYKLHKQ